MIEEKSIKLEKDVAEVHDLVVVLIKEIKAKKSAGEITAAILPSLIMAIEGLDTISLEDKEVLINTVGVKMGEIIGCFL